MPVLIHASEMRDKGDHVHAEINERVMHIHGKPSLVKGHCNCRPMAYTPQETGLKPHLVCLCVVTLHFAHQRLSLLLRASLAALLLLHITAAECEMAGFKSAEEKAAGPLF